MSKPDCAALALTFLLSAAAPTQEPAVRGPKPPTASRAVATQPSVADQEPACPVTGQKIDPSVFAEFRGKKVYFATVQARDKFLADPYEYGEAVKRQWEALRPVRVQVLCPVTRKPVNPQVSLERDGETVLFASPEAKTAWERDPQRFRDGLRTCYTFQVLCPCGTSEINPAVALEVHGRTIYFCCPHCRAAFQREAAPDLSKLDEQIKANQERWEKRQAKPSAGKP